MALLTIDDAPSTRFSDKLDWLDRRGISAVFFCWGERMAGYDEQLIRALRQGHVLANHSWSHPHFSELSWPQALAEVEQTQTVIDDLYLRAGVRQTIKSFRFPYLDPGKGELAGRLQTYLEQQGYRPMMAMPEGRLDTGCTFDQMEYWLGKEEAPDGLNRQRAVLARIRAGAPANDDVILIHDHDHTHDVFMKCVSRYLRLGLSFEAPAR